MCLFFFQQMNFGENSILSVCLMSERQLFILHSELYYIYVSFRLVSSFFVVVAVVGPYFWNWAVCLSWFLCFVLSIYLLCLIYTTKLLHLEFLDYLLISQIYFSNNHCRQNYRIFHIPMQDNRNSSASKWPNFISILMRSTGNGFRSFAIEALANIQYYFNFMLKTSSQMVTFHWNWRIWILISCIRSKWISLPTVIWMT